MAKPLHVLHLQGLLHDCRRTWMLYLVSIGWPAHDLDFIAAVASTLSTCVAGLDSSTTYQIVQNLSHYAHKRKVRRLNDVNLQPAA
jgi:hypothetical protein